MNYDIQTFVKTVTAYWKTQGRHGLPWRHTDAYGVLVSEIMLQQTQVDRVVPYFKKWMKRFPTVQKLAKAPLSLVLKEWSGLGYNRRAKLLRACAKEIVEKHGGKIPKDFAALVALPAIGPYTAGAICAFAFDEKEVCIETNIRAALIHHFFSSGQAGTLRSLGEAGRIDDTQLIPILKKCLVHVNSSREWYSALMDYGTHIKKTNPNPSRRSKHHTQQSKFKGSTRQARGAILRKLLDGPISEKSLLNIDVRTSYQVELAIKDLQGEGLIKKKKNKWWIA